MIKWTAQDEAQLKALTQQRTDFYQTNLEPLAKLCEVKIRDVCRDDAFNMAEDLAKYADVFRDALAPFDSGVRAMDKR